jgi:hypothetical protein
MRRLVIGLAAFAAGTWLVQAQPPAGLPAPRVSTAFPPGAKAGTGLEVTVTGADLDEPTALYFSHPGIKGEYVPPPDPPADPKKKDAPPAGMKKAAPAAGPHKFKVTVAPDVPPGTYDVRVVGKWGVSNPRAFVVGAVPEVPEKEPNNDVPEAQKVEIGTTVLGQIANPTDVDYTVFSGKAGQKVVIHCRASSIDSKARPMIEVYDAGGKKLAQNRNYHDTDAVTDLVLPSDGDFYVRLFEFTYTTGSADHTYRLTISSAPWVDSVYPPAVEFGKPAQVTVFGRNLPGGQPSGFSLDGRPLEKLAVTITPPGDPLAAQRLTVVRDHIAPADSLQDGFAYTLQGPGGVSNPVPVYFAREKVVVKKNAGGTKMETAEPIPAPCEVAGMIARKNDRDWYSFDAKKGEPVMIELTGERNGSPADFFFSVHNPAAKNDMMGPEQDDDADVLHPTEFPNRSGDPAPYRFVPPMDGKYLVGVGCRDSSYLTGPATTYRLRVGPPRPDFRVVARTYTKSYQYGSAARQDGTEAIDVYVHRMDGFAGEVAVTAENLPAGVTTKGTTIGGGARWGVMVLKVAPGAAPAVAAITVKATATVDGKPVVREARPATVTWGTNQQNNNQPIVGRLAQSLVIAVRPEKAFFQLAADPAAATLKNAMGKDEKLSGPLFVTQGQKLTLPVKVTWLAGDKVNVTVAADPVAPGQQNAPFTVTAPTQPTKDKAEGVVTIDVKANAFPGKYAAVLRGEAQVPFVREGAKGNKANVPAVAFAEPVEFTVLPTTLAKVTPGQLPNNTLKLGKTAELAVKVERLYGYAGDYKVTFALPKDATGVTAPDVVIPAGKADAAILVLTAADNTKAGAVNNALVTVTGRFAGKDVATETKVNFTIGK